MKRLAAILKYVLFFAVGIGLFLLAILNQDPDELISGFINADYTYVLLAMLAAVFSTISRAIRWTMLINPFGYKVSAFSSFMALMNGYLANLAIPRIGEVTRCVVLNKSHNVPINKLIGTVVIERTIDILSTLILMVYILIFELERIKSFFTGTGIRIPQFSDVSSSVYWLILAGLILIIALLFYFYKKKKKSLFWYRFKEQIYGFVTGLKSIKTVKNYWYFIFHSVFIWFTYILMTYACFFAIESTSHLSFSTSIFVMVVGAIGFIAPVQGGIGTYHWMVQESLFLFDIVRADGLVYATIAHAAQTVFVIIIGGISLILFLINQRKKRLVELFEKNKK